MAPTNHPFVTVRDPRDSVWQSVVERVAKREAAAAARPAAGVAFKATAAGSMPTQWADLVDAAHAEIYERDALSHRVVFEAHGRPMMLTAGPRPIVAKVSAGESTKRCAALALQWAKAKVFGTPEQAKVVENALKFNAFACDPFWVRCGEEYAKHFLSLAGRAIPYRPGLNNVLPTSVPSNAVLAIFGDWGTGTDEASELLGQIKGFNPDILMHLGDVYYSGTKDEMQERFLKVCDSVFGSAMPRRFSLSGNHDMYSGGQGYYWLVDQLGQEASYFAIQNGDWLFIAMDTGLHDHQPLQFGSAATFLAQSEADWVNGLIADRGSKKVVLLSHHPLFSAFDAIAGGSVNPVLLSQIQNSLTNVTAWFWGHEHRLAIYDPFQGLERGRCLGHAAVPVFADATGDPPKFARVPVHRENGALLEMGSADGLFKHGFAIMTLNGSNATVAYYRQGEADPLWSETF